MALGRVVKFDEVRGFGFIAPVGGREDVFLHVNDLLIPESLVRPGTMLEFDIDEGERGLKASNVSLSEDNSAPAGPARMVGAAAARVAMAPPAASAPAPPAVTEVNGKSATHAESDEFCDVLTMDEFRSQITEMLLAAVPPLTSEQILNMRGQLADFAKNSGWLAS